MLTISSSRLASEAGRSASPYMVSELGHLSDDGKATNKAKGKSKAKRSGEHTCTLPLSQRLDSS